MTDDCIRIVVPFDLHRLAPNTRLHPWVRREAQRNAKQMARFAYIAAGSPTMEGPVVVSLIIRRGRVIDPDAALASCKHLLDGLFCARRNEWGGITPDDSARYITYGPVLQETGTEWKGREEVEVIVVPKEVR